MSDERSGGFANNAVMLAAATVQLQHADLPMLERLAYRRDELAARLPAITAGVGAHSVVLLSTCNRVELYAALPHDVDAGQLIDALAIDRQVSSADVRRAARLLSGPDVARHLLRVAAGLESLAVGEAEIAGQVRAAAVAARRAGVLTGELDALFRAAATTARRVRRETALGCVDGSLGAAAVDHAVRALTGTSGVSARPLDGRTVLVVGAGQLATAVARRARAYGARLVVCNRTRSRAVDLVVDPRDAVNLDALPAVLAGADIAVVCTSAPWPLIDADTMPARTRTDGTLLIDLAVPRNIDPAVRAVAGVTVYDLDDLRGIGLPEAAQHRAAVAGAQLIVEQQAARYAEWLRCRRAAELIRGLHAQADAVVRAELERASTALPGLRAEVVEQVTRRVVNKLLHGPTVSVRRAALNGDDALLERAAELLGQPPRPSVTLDHLLHCTPTFPAYQTGNGANHFR